MTVCLADNLEEVELIIRIVFHVDFYASGQSDPKHRRLIVHSFLSLQSKGFLARLNHQRDSSWHIGP
mgnify:CR=1 FL=1